MKCSHCKEPFYCAFHYVNSLNEVRQQNLCKKHAREIWNELPANLKESVVIFEQPFSNEQVTSLDQVRRGRDPESAEAAD